MTRRARTLLQRTKIFTEHDGKCDPVVKRSRDCICATCGTSFDRGYAMSAKRSATNQFCSSKCRNENWTARKNERSESHFWSRVDMRGTDECWTFKGHRRELGYGWVNFLGKPQNAHRVAYKLAKGEIGAGLFVCHSCDNPPCCNPNHLWLGTCKENTLDMVAKGRNVSKPNFGEKHHMAKITNKDAVEIFNSAESAKKLGKKYGISGVAVRNIKIGKTWTVATRASNATE